LLTVGDPNANSYYHADGNGNITALMNSNGLLVASYTYDPFGNVLSMSGPLADANVYRFSSKEFGRNSGLYYYGFRFYDANSQRWVNRDPIDEEGGLNVYRYLENSPMVFIDPVGLQCLLEVPPVLLDPPPVVPRPLIEQAIQLNRGAARVRLPDGRNVDLFGRSHFDKPTQTEIPTPHVHEPAPASLAPRFPTITRPANLGDILDSIIQLKGSLSTPGTGPGCSGCRENGPPATLNAPPGVLFPGLQETPPPRNPLEC
jgi:RHS repeat-associated protein